ncbi:MAG: GTPase [Clostridia bacterium]|nr:GTPase [Clostridia bacterium]
MSNQDFIAVYLITGFLESGKTTLINSMLQDEDFSRGQKTLIICCEEGMEEYDLDAIADSDTTIVTLDSAEEVTTEKMAELNETYKPERVIIEYNSVWTIERLGSCMLPRKWEVVQILTTVDANTFDNYFTNLRQILTDPMKVADLILVNRCEPKANKSPWRRQLKSVAPRANIIFENTDGTSEDGVADEDLPYDMKAGIIDIADEHIATFYLDAMDHPERYDRKTIRMVGQCFADKQLPKGYYMFGRMAMTCCADDIAPIGWICQGLQRPSSKAYVKLTAQCKRVTSGGEAMVMLQEVRVEPAAAPAEKYLSFN